MGPKLAFTPTPRRNNSCIKRCDNGTEILYKKQLQ